MNYKSTVTALALLVCISLTVGASAQSSDRSATLLEELSGADEAEAARLEKELRLEWSKSGSAAMDLLLKRGNDALEINQTAKAIEHFTALTDHAPEFAQGWYGLALAYYQADAFGPSADALERTLALNPHHFAALRGLASLFEQLDQPVLAYDAYSRVLEIRPHDKEVGAAMERLELQVRGTEL